MQPLFEHRMEFAGFETRVLELEGKGTPIALFHGFADSADTWRQALAVLARHDQRAVAVDLPGFARAAELGDGAILPQLDAFAAAVLEYAAGDSGAPAVAVGNSLGGCVALRAAERVDLAGAVAVAPAGLDMAGWFVLLERDALLRSLLAVPVPVPPAVMRAVVARLYMAFAFARPGEISPLVVSAFTNHHRDRETVRRYMATGRRMLRELRNPFELEQIRCPVLLVWGDKDRLVFPSGAERVLAAVPGARLELFDGCGHCPQIEATERFTKLLLEFAEAGSAQAA